MAGIKGQIAKLAREVEALQSADGNGQPRRIIVTTDSRQPGAFWGNLPALGGGPHTAAQVEAVDASADHGVLIIEVDHIEAE